MLCLLLSNMYMEGVMLCLHSIAICPAMHVPSSPTLALHSCHSLYLAAKEGAMLCLPLAAACPAMHMPGQAQP